MSQPPRRSNWTLAAFAAPCLPLAGLGQGLDASGIIAGLSLTEKRHAEIRDALVARDLAQSDIAGVAPGMGSDPKLAEEIHAITRPAE